LQKENKVRVVGTREHPSEATQQQQVPLPPSPLLLLLLVHSARAMV
jgi:hypothetical protein